MRAFVTGIFIILALPVFSQDYLVIDTTQANLQRYAIYDTIENLYPMGTIIHDIDMNDDGAIDFSFRSSGSIGGGGGSAGMRLWAHGDNFYVSDTMHIDSTVYGLSPNVVDTFEIVRCYEYGDTIRYSDYFISDTTAIYIWWEIQYPPAELDVDLWVGGNKYMGIKKVIDNIVYYGWIKLHVQGIMNTYILESAIYFSPFNVGEHEPPGLLIYPNPADEIIHIQAEGYDRMRIVNIAGEVFLDQQLSRHHKEESFDISHLKPSIYLIQLSNPAQKISAIKKLVVL